jgi:hypothetical protein
MEQNGGRQRISVKEKMEIFRKGQNSPFQIAYMWRNA